MPRIDSVDREVGACVHKGIFGAANRQHAITEGCSGCGGINDPREAQAAGHKHPRAAPAVPHGWRAGPSLLLPLLADAAAAAGATRALRFVVEAQRENILLDIHLHTSQTSCEQCIPQLL